MDAERDRVRAIVELQGILADTEGLQDYLDKVAASAADHIAPEAQATVTLQRDGRTTVAASSGPGARECDEIEYAVGSGPCLSALETGRPFLIPSLEKESRWPRWTAAALDRGFRSGAAFPAEVEDGPAVAINVYTTVPGGTDGSERAGLAYAEEASRALRLVLRLADEAELTADLRATLASRQVIDQAVGVIMAQNRCTASEAVDILKSASQNRNMKLRDVAARIVEALTGHPADATVTFAPRAQR